MKISSPPGNVIGTIQQKWDIIGTPKFDIKDAFGDVVLRIEGPFWTCSCGSDVYFKVKLFFFLNNNNNNRNGIISNRY